MDPYEVLSNFLFGVGILGVIFCIGVFIYFLWENHQIKKFTVKTKKKVLEYDDRKRHEAR